VRVLVQLLLGLGLPRVNLDARGDHALDAFGLEVELFDELLHLPGVGFVLEAVARPPNDAIQHSRLLVVGCGRAEAASHSQFVMLLDRALEPVELVLGARHGEVVAVHRYCKSPLHVVEHAS
jgi:hypothetical protein